MGEAVRALEGEQRTHLCPHRRTLYADVCWRMLTYAAGGGGSASAGERTSTHVCATAYADTGG
jgi:hypothetical protein